MTLLNQSTGIQPCLAWLLANVPPALQEPLRTDAQRVLETIILKFGRLQGTIIETASQKQRRNSGLTLMVFDHGDIAGQVRQFMAETVVELGEDEVLEEMVDRAVRELEAEGEVIEDVDPSDFPDEPDLITEKVIDLVSTCIGEPCVHLDHTLVGQLGFDSLDRIEFVIFLEGEFNISIPDAESDKFRTVGDVVTYIKDNTL